jgi:hypothetical protein
MEKPLSWLVHLFVCGRLENQVTIAPVSNPTAARVNRFRGKLHVSLTFRSLAAKGAPNELTLQTRCATIDTRAINWAIAARHLDFSLGLNLQSPRFQSNEDLISPLGRN